MQHPRYSAAGEYYTPGTSASASPVLPVFAARSDPAKSTRLTTLRSEISCRGEGTHGVLEGYSGTLKGYSRGTQEVLKGY